MGNGIERKNSTLMKKLIMYFLVVIFLMLSLNMYSMYGFKLFYINFHTMLKKLVEIHYISIRIDEAYQDVENYAHSGSTEYVNGYHQKIIELQNHIQQLKDGSTGEVRYKYKDIGKMVETFDEKGENIIRNYNVQMEQIYINHLVAELSRLKGYIQDEVKGLLLNELLSVQSHYSSFQTLIRRQENTIYILTACITLLCIVFVVRFTRKISTPIHQLVLRLKRFAKGDLEVKPISYKTNDEINVLIESFNFMITEIKSLINRIEEKASIERKLKEQEIKNLEISNLLKQSELKFLQSQINPHFLFNTMNSIAALADIEEAVQTKKMLESMAYILRYNLSKLNENITLREEVEIVKNYLYIQRIRFGNRIEYILDIDQSALDYKIPSMILQPIVENAIVHGLESKEEGGKLELRIHDKGENIIIVVKDNGLGITQEKLQSIINCKDDTTKDDCRTGIGLSNVIRRLEIKYGKNVVEIDSQVAVGTEVRMTLEKSQP
ncbi:MAG TPA: sensor histidine kinase [Clostridiaceae bacterium]|nr:sensor histidine kinase [Clostridiaceae bacterium]